ncbi:MAG: hypothetical protein KDD78_03520 [Caldilineaceae bacterium]|nr:hypothetical protein [Caldilineaceae bacterium]
MPELCAVGPDHAPADWIFYGKEPVSSLTAAVGLVHRWPARDHAAALMLFARPHGFLLQFPGLADFEIDPEKGTVVAHPLHSTNVETVRHLLLDQVLPRLLAHQGQFILHASAVKVMAKAIAFVGESGIGKSTLAAGFHMAGDPVLSDDGLSLTWSQAAVFAQPTYPSLRLWPASIAQLGERPFLLAPMAHYSDKRRVSLAPTVEEEPLALAAIVVLERLPDTSAPGIAVSPLSARDGCMQLVRNSFQLDVTDHVRAAAILNAAAHVVERVPVYHMTYRHDFAALPAVRAAILSLCA